MIRQLYVDALRGWVRKGEDSEYALSTEQVRQSLRKPTENDAWAAVHVRLGRHFYIEGDVESATRHLKEAVQICPQKWHYRRQSMALAPETVGQINLTPEFWEAFDELGDATYYPAADIPGMPR